MSLAAWIGTTVRFTDYYNSVFLEKEDGSANVLKRHVFENLYYRLDKFTAALKSDCIDYVMYDPISELYDQPGWYIELVEDGIIKDYCGFDLFYPESGEEIYMNPRSVILRNFEGDFKYMEYDEFIKYYDIPGSEFIG